MVGYDESAVFMEVRRFHPILESLKVKSNVDNFKYLLLPIHTWERTEQEAYLSRVGPYEIQKEDRGLKWCL